MYEIFCNIYIYIDTLNNSYPTRVQNIVAAERMPVVLSGVRQAGRFRPLYRGRFLGSLAPRYVGHSSNACKSLGIGGGQTLLNGYPKGLSAKRLSKQACLIRPVMWTVLEPRPGPSDLHQLSQHCQDSSGIEGASTHKPV